MASQLSEWWRFVVDKIPFQHLFYLNSEQKKMRYDDIA